MKQISTSLIIALLFSLGFSSCGTDSPKPVLEPEEEDNTPKEEEENTPEPEKKVVIYTAGMLALKAAYWVDGVSVSLTDRKHESRANGIAVVGDDVHVVGYEYGDEYNPQRVSNTRVAKYWKNGVLKNLSAENGYTLAQAITVVDGVVHIIGQERKGGLTPRIHAKYWRDGKEVTLEDDEGAYPFAVAAVGNDVHIVGSTKNNTAVYWKNGIRIDLPGGAAEAMGIAIAGNDVYIVGRQALGTLRSKIKYWKNGELMGDITDGVHYARGMDIAVNGNDVYIVGQEDGTAKYWKNGTPVEVTEGKGSGINVFRVMLSGNDIYLGGTMFASGITQAYYWKNNEINPMPGSTISDMIIVTKE